MISVLILIQVCNPDVKFLQPFRLENQMKGGLRQPASILSENCLVNCTALRAQIPTNMHICTYCKFRALLYFSLGYKVKA
jgi:hypothetical protein